MKLQIDDQHEFINLIEYEFLSYIPLSVFAAEKNNESTLTYLKESTVKSCPWNETKVNIDNIYYHVCSYAIFNDMKFLLQRNDLWSDEVKHYASHVFNGFTKCHVSSPSYPTRTFSISTLSKGLNEIVFDDLFYLNNIRIFHSMDMVTRFSSGHILKPAALDDFVFVLKTIWLSQFWILESGHGGEAFRIRKFKTYLATLRLDLYLLQYTAKSRL